MLSLTPTFCGNGVGEQFIQHTNRAGDKITSTFAVEPIGSRLVV
jgi:hypothetical protein